jgi:replicative DNA helicase
MSEPVSKLRPIRAHLGKTPPQAIEMEQSVLGAILLDSEALPKTLEIFADPDVFYHPIHRSIYRTMLSLYERNQPVDLMTVSEGLKKDGVFDDVGYEYLAELIEYSPTAANVRAHARVILEKSLLRKLITVAGEVATLAYEDDGEVDDLLDRVERMVLEVSQERASKSLVPIKEFIKESIKTAERLYDNKQLVTGVSTGFTDLDERTAGFHPSDLIIVAGRPSMGKTAFALNIGQSVAAAKEQPVVAIFSLEMSAEQLVLRMLCAEAKVSQQKVRSGFLAQSDWPKLTAAAGRLHNYKIYIDDSPGATSLDIRAKARRLMWEQGRIDLIVIDYLQLMSSRGRVESRVQEISEITRSLKQLAKELSCPVVAISQLSRKVEDRPDKRPQLADLRESGSIEQDADLVVFIYREEYYHRDKPEFAGLAEAIIAKQRNGPVDTIKLTFLKEYLRFENYSGRGEPGGGGGYDEPL